MTRVLIQHCLWMTKQSPSSRCHKAVVIKCHYVVIKRHYVVIEPKCGSEVQIFCGNTTWHWLEMPGNMSSEPHDDPEIKRNATIVVAKEDNGFVHDLITYFSS